MLLTKHLFPFTFSTGIQLLEALKLLLREKHGHLLQPPWVYLFEDVDWGPTDKKSLEVVMEVPGTSAFMAVEVNWGVGKNHVARNWFEGRSFQNILDMLMDEWLSDGKTPCSKFFTHCEKDINKWIQWDRDCNEGPLSGEVGTDSFKGIPSEEEMAQWEDKAKLALIDVDLEPANTDDVGNERYEIRRIVIVICNCRL